MIDEPKNEEPKYCRMAEKVIEKIRSVSVTRPRQGKRFCVAPKKAD
ncbi:MAG: hypothetical protein L6W00_15350 [Lentisphaeria bacterium]|nr:MAG: hypothetical protein L6W00_15350 [Lentisphaeria bacterium]